MPVRFICRLLAKPTKSGGVMIVYGYLGDDQAAEIVEMHGPEMVIPPANELTRAEFDKWEWDLSQRGFSRTIREIKTHEPLVEAKKTIEDEILKGEVETELFWAEDSSGERTLGVRVTSNRDWPIPNFSMSTDCQYDAPQPEKIGKIEAQNLGGSESMFHAIEIIYQGDLWPKIPIGFALDPRVMKPLRSRAASLSPESHWITLRTDEYEFDRIPGATITEFLMEENQDV